MAAEPLIIDDGGSTRIKQLKDDVNMDKLLGLAGVFADKAAGEFEEPVGTFKCSVKVRYHETDGSHHILPPADADRVLQHDDKIEIVSQNGQVVTLSFDAGNKMVVKLTSSAAGIDPIVEAKQNGRQRRYVVTNAGPVLTVTRRRVGADLLIFNAAGTPSVYTMIHLRPNDP
jgi:hypothetical protein